MKITRSSIATRKGPAEYFSGDVYIVHCNQTDFVDTQLTADDFPDFAFQHFTDPLESEGRHMNERLYCLTPRSSGLPEAQIKASGRPSPSCSIR